MHGVGARITAPGCPVPPYDRHVITDPDAVRVLCFGDSNTYGTCLRDSNSDGTPTNDPDYVRLNADRRWTGVLQRLLGDGYDVIEEALNGRTTDVDYDDRPGCNGRSYFVPCLLSHRPLDVVVVMLGGNDLKPSFHRTPTAIAEALGAYVDDIAANVTDRQGRTPMIVLVGPIRIDDTAPKYRDLVGENFDPSIPGRSRELATEIRRVARERGTLFAAAAEVARPGDDGLHLSQDSHARLAELIASTVMKEM
jgi:lysophospholipase L1-like esterase